MKIIFFIIFIFQLIPLFSQELKEAPLSNDFIIYKNNLKNNNQILVPTPVEIKHNLQNSLNINTPENYNLKDLGFVTPAKNQGNCGCCWAFACLGSIESNWLMNGYGSYDLSEESMRNCHGFDIGGCTSGNHLFALAYLSRIDGPYLESEIPYHIIDSICKKGFQPISIITEAVFLPKNQSVIKQFIIENGGVYSTIFWNPPPANSYNGNMLSPYYDTYYYSGTDAVNHAVLIIGWDNNKLTAGGTGAWLVKNSWGTSCSYCDYFWVSYNDKKFASTLCAFTKKTDYNRNLKLYMYDELGWTSSIGYNGSEAYGLVKFTATENQKITQVATFVNTGSAAIDIEIYYDKKGNNLYNLIGEARNIKVEHPGYYTFDLTKQARVLKGTDFFVKIKYQTPNNSYPIPVEKSIENYTSPTIMQNVSWVSKTGVNWESLGANVPGKESNVCIRAFALPDTLLNITAGTPIYNLYPNPTTRYLNIDLLYDSSDVINITIYDIKGIKVIEDIIYKQAKQYIKRIDLSTIEKGVYFIKIFSPFINDKKKIVLF